METTELPAKYKKRPFSEGYEHWRHGGWYTNARYPSGACGCVSNNYTDKKWRIACGDDHDITFSTRADAAKAEHVMCEALKEQNANVAIVAARLEKLRLALDPKTGTMPISEATAEINKLVSLLLFGTT